MRVTKTRYTRLKIGPVSAECLRQTSRLEDIYYNATDVFVTFTKQNNFPDAENLGSTTTAKIAEKVGLSQQDVFAESSNCLLEMGTVVATR